MKGITIINDETHNKRYIQIEESLFEKYSGQLEDLFDIIVVELRKGKGGEPFEDFVNDLKKEGKLAERKQFCR
jgi:hypothetical protein